MSTDLYNVVFGGGAIKEDLSVDDVQKNLSLTFKMSPERVQKDIYRSSHDDKIQY